MGILSQGIWGRKEEAEDLKLGLVSLRFPKFQVGTELLFFDRALFLWEAKKAFAHPNLSFLAEALAVSSMSCVAVSL